MQKQSGVIEGLPVEPCTHYLTVTASCVGRITSWRCPQGEFFSRIFVGIVTLYLAVVIDNFTYVSLLAERFAVVVVVRAASLRYPPRVLSFLGQDVADIHFFQRFVHHGQF